MTSHCISSWAWFKYSAWYYFGYSKTLKVQNMSHLTENPTVLTWNVTAPQVRCSENTLSLEFFYDFLSCSNSPGCSVVVKKAPNAKRQGRQVKKQRASFVDRANVKNLANRGKKPRPKLNQVQTCKKGRHEVQNRPGEKLWTADEPTESEREKTLI